VLARQTDEQQVNFSKTLVELDRRFNVINQNVRFLLTSDEPVARGYLTKGFKVAQERFREKGNDLLVRSKMILRRVDYRFEFVRAIAKFDGE
jgi:hypothetical protein